MALKKLPPWAYAAAFGGAFLATRAVTAGANTSGPLEETPATGAATGKPADVNDPGDYGGYGDYGGQFDTFAGVPPEGGYYGGSTSGGTTSSGSVGTPISQSDAPPGAAPTSLKPPPPPGSKPSGAAGYVRLQGGITIYTGTYDPKAGTVRITKAATLVFPPTSYWVSGAARATYAKGSGPATLRRLYNGGWSSSWISSAITVYS